MLLAFKKNLKIDSLLLSQYPPAPPKDAQCAALPSCFVGKKSEIDEKLDARVLRTRAVCDGSVQDAAT